MKRCYQLLLFLIPTLLFTQSTTAQILHPKKENEVFMSEDVIAKIVDLNQDGIDEVITNISNVLYIDNMASGVYRGDAFGDFNEDGFLDFVGTDVSLRLSNTANAFGDPDFYDSPTDPLNTVTAGTAPGLAVGDFDGDDNLDVIAYQFNSTFQIQQFYLYSGDGTGGFTDPVALGNPTYIGSTYFLQAMGIDFDGDGDLDLVTNSGTGLRIHAGDGSGSIDFGTTILDFEKAGEAHLISGNVDGDGDIDLLFETDSLYTILNNGVSAPSVINQGYRVSYDFEFGYFNDDNILDFVEDRFPITYYLGDGSGNFTKSANTYVNPFLVIGFNVKPVNRNNDGISDLYFTSNSSDSESFIAESQVEPGRYSGLITATNLNTPNREYEALELTDMDGDGYDDVALLIGDSLLIKINNGLGGFGESAYYITSENPSSLVTMDIDDDTDQDLIIGCSSGDNNNIQIFINDGSGVFASPVNIVSESNFRMVTGDFNNDGNPDLVTNGNTNNINVFLNNGSGGLSSPISILARNGSSLGALDFDNDGNLDLVIASGSNVYGLPGDGTGSFIYDFNTRLFGGPYVVTGDFNDDGIDDFVSVSSTNDTYQSWLGVEGADFMDLNAVSSSILPSNVREGLKISDFNDDGILDLIRSGDGEEIFVALGDGTGKFVEYEIPLTGGLSGLEGPIGIGDINNDSKADVIHVGKYVSNMLLMYQLENIFELSAEPVTQASNITFTNITSDSAQVNWTRGDGNGVVVMGLSEDQPKEFGIPQDRDAETVVANSQFPFVPSTRFGGNSYVLYDGPADSVILSNLPINTTFFIQVIEYNGDILNRNYLLTEVSEASFTTLKGDQLLTISQSDDKEFEYEPFAPNLTTNSGLELTLSIVDGSATITEEGLIELTDLGQLVYDIDQAGNDDWNALPTVRDTIQILKGNQSISFNLNATTFIQEEDLQLPVYTSNDLPISYTIDAGSGSLRMSGDTTFYEWDGETNLTLTASQAGNNLVNAAVPVSRSTNILKQDQTINWGQTQFVTEQGSTINSFLDGKTIQFRNDTLELNATSSAGLPVSFIITEGPGFLKGINEDSKFYIFNKNAIGTGNVSVSASTQGNDIYNTAIPVEISFTIVKGDQTITFQPDFPNPVYSEDLRYKLGATSSSGLDINYTLSGNGIGTVENDTLYVEQAGTISIEASQDGNDNWNAANDVTRGVGIDKAQQTITYEEVGGKLRSDSPFELDVSVSSGLELEISSNTGRTTISDKTVTIRNDILAGQESIYISQSGNENYYSANQGIINFCISANKPVISELSKGFLQTDNTLDQVQWYLDDQSIGTTANQPINVTENGTYTAIALAQDGCPASETSDPFDYVLNVLGLDQTSFQIYPNPIKDVLSIEMGSEESLDVTISNIDGKVLLKKVMTRIDNQINLSEYGAGVYLVRIKGTQVDSINRIIKE